MRREILPATPRGEADESLASTRMSAANDSDASLVAAATSKTQAAVRLETAKLIQTAFVHASVTQRMCRVLKIRRLACVEALGVPHVRPDIRLDVRQQLAKVVPVVVDPFAEQVLHSQEADPGVMAAAGQVNRA